MAQTFKDLRETIRIRFESQQNKLCVPDVSFGQPVVPDAEGFLADVDAAPLAVRLGGDGGIGKLVELDAQLADVVAGLVDEVAAVLL